MDIISITHKRKDCHVKYSFTEVMSQVEINSYKKAKKQTKQFSLVLLFKWEF